MSTFQGQPKDELLFLASAGTAAVGVVYSGVTVRYRRVGASVWTPKTLVSYDFSEIGSGFYTLHFAPVELGPPGLFIYQVSGAGFDPVLKALDVEPQPTAFLAAPGTCVITGNIVDLGGLPGVGTEITFRSSNLPASIAGSMISGGLFTTYPDAYGNFSVALLQGASLILEIGALGLKLTFTVPAQTSATLLSLLPPF